MVRKHDVFASPGEPDDEATFARGRVADRTYLSKSFVLDREGSADHGEPARFVYKVFDGADELELAHDGEEWLVSESPGGRVQVKLLVARDGDNIKDLWIQRVPTGNGSLKQVLQLRGDDALRLADLVATVRSMPVEGADTVRIDDDLLRDVLQSPDALDALYRDNPGHFRTLLANDEYANDVVALAARRRALEKFELLLNDYAYFDKAVNESDGGAERVWQDLFEANPWMFGVTLTGQLLTSWDPERLEQSVLGSSVDAPGKRVDALMRTSGRIRSMVFAEIKTHRTPLLDREYRPGCWSPSRELAGGVAQVHGTVHLATQRIGERLQAFDDDGSEILGEEAYLFRPRSFLVIGHLAQAVGQGGGVQRHRFRSLELYRRQLQEPEVITFDELLARARWVVDQSPASDG